MPLPDPYHLFEYKSEEWPYRSFEELLKTHDLANVNIEPQNKSATDETILPNFLHYLFVLNPIPDTYKDMIAEGKKQNPHYRFTLWVDKHVYEKEEFEKLKQWAKDNSIHLVDVNSSVGNCLGDAGLLYQMEMKKKWPGSATDMLRLKILSHFGGIYSDTTDIVCTGKLSDNVALSHGVNLSTYGRTFFEEDPLESLKKYNAYGWPEPRVRTVFNNDWIAAVPNSPFIQNAIARFQENYTKPLTELLTGKYVDITTDRSLYDYRDYQHTPMRAFSAQQFKFEWTKAMAGPGNLGAAVSDLSQEAVDAIQNQDLTDYPDTSKFLFSLASTWAKNPPQRSSNSLTEEEKEKNRQYHITFQLHQLVIEPRRIFFELYEHTSDLEREQLLNKLFGDFRDQLEDVEYIEINWGSPVNSYSIETIEKILDPEFFPKLSYKDIFEDFKQGIPAPDQIIENLRESTQLGSDGVAYRKAVAQYLHEYSLYKTSCVDPEKLKVIQAACNDSNPYLTKAEIKLVNETTDIAFINSNLIPEINNFITNQIKRLEGAFFKNSQTISKLEQFKALQAEFKAFKLEDIHSMHKFYSCVEKVHSASNFRRYEKFDKARASFFSPKETTAGTEFDTLIRQSLATNANKLTDQVIECTLESLDLTNNSMTPT
ncbi:glycosyltransferase [Legionella quinlivanii]|uniref:glycosyltransferase n=1 Tax=Legionella quinlivanii TaxID=45073 RepID=UPI0022448F1D|nr:glycosyltransferase [Legionella quinlivanii]MCW8450169.1 glycosyltransferase [Legionella quinlivanii]